jgi:ABC-type transport system involved in multi-copper enzyme maturation permease subunit
MSSKAITERKDDAPQPYRWQTPAEAAPSLTQDTEPLVARWVGAFGLAFIVLGGVSLLVTLTGRTSWIPGWLAVLSTVLGLGMLLFHAASDAELQVRRAYMAFGGLWLLLGAFFSLVPWGGPVGAKFLPYGLTFLVLGLLFLMAFVRNETDAQLRDGATYALGAAGLIAALVGFVGSNVAPNFLFTHGLFLIVLGLFFLWAFVAVRGVADDKGYWGALALGGVGLAAFLVAVVRSLIPALAERGWLFGPEAGRWFHLMPHGMVLAGAGLAYLAISLGLVSEQPFVVMTRRELSAFFNSPVAYFMLLLFTAVAFVQFGLFVLENLYSLAPPMPGQAMSQTLPVPEPMIRPYVFSLVSIFCLVFLVPVLTMHLVSEEKRSGTLEMTLTAPQEESTIVLSKFAAGLFMFLLTWVPWVLYLVALRFEGTKSGEESFDYQPLLAWMIVLLFTGAGFVAMGVFFSSLTRNQLLAAVLTFVAMLLLVGLFLVKQNVMEPGGLWHTVFTRVSFIDSWWDALDGKLGLSDLIYHLSVTVFWLFLTVKVLESRKWR